MKYRIKRNGTIAVIIVSFILIVAIAMWRYIAMPYNGEIAWIYIPANATDTAVKDSICVALGNKTGTRVYNLLEKMGGPSSPTHGAFRIEPGMASYKIAHRLAHNSESPITVTFNNLRTIDQLAVRISNKLELSPDAFKAACDSILSAAGFNHNEFASAFIPNSYDFYWTASPEHVVNTLLTYRNNFWTDNRREKAKSIGLSPIEVTTLASIVEEETAANSERPIVARLYLNRLKRGMRLQADPTVKWAVGDFSLRRITGKHLNVDSPYNTYKYAGLPPGPIRIPEQATIDAVLDAPAHNYIYMCAKADFSGTHNFASDFKTHMQNAAAYQKALNNRKIN